MYIYPDQYKIPRRRGGGGGEGGKDRKICKSKGKFKGKNETRDTWLSQKEIRGKGERWKGRRMRKKTGRKDRKEREPIK
jgi:hypothetical protein